VEFDDALFDDFAEMASLAGINDDFPSRRHAGSVAVLVQSLQYAFGA
jgi:hypothetical protein